MPKTQASPALRNVLQVYKKVLKWAFAAVGMLHILYLMGIYAIGGSYPLWQTVVGLDKWLPLLVFIAAGVWLLLVCLCDPWQKKRCFTAIRKRMTADQILLTLLLVWCLIGCLVLQSGSGHEFFTYMDASGTWMGLNQSKTFSLNDRPLRDMVISFFVLYPLGSLFGEKERRRLLNGIICILAVAASVVTVLVLFNLLNNRITVLPGGQAGLDSAGFLVIACNSNTTGAFSAMLLLLFGYMVVVCKKIPVKILFGTAAILQLILLCLSGSRAAVYSVAAAAAAIGFRVVWTSEISFSDQKVKLAVSAVIGVLCAAAVLLVNGAIQDAVRPTVSDTQGGTAASTYVKSGLSGRTNEWRDSLNATFANSQNAITGVTPAFVEYAIGMMRNEPDNAKYAHNQFIQMLLAFGLPGLGLYIAWLVDLAKRCFRVGMKTAYFMLPVTVLMLIIGNLAESYLVAYSYFCGSVFFLVCGMVKCEDESLKEREAAQSRMNHRKKKKS